MQSVLRYSQKIGAKQIIWFYTKNKNTSAVIGKDGLTGAGSADEKH